MSLNSLIGICDGMSWYNSGRAYRKVCSRSAPSFWISFIHSSSTGEGKRSTTNLTNQTASSRLALAIAETSQLIKTCRASTSSNSWSFDLESLLPVLWPFDSYQAPCQSFLQLGPYAWVCQVHSWSCRSISEEQPSKIFVIAVPDDITVPYSFRFRLELSVNSCRWSCMAFFWLQAIKCPLTEFLALSIST